jgi:preprotein translocase subunit YajC
MPYRRAAPLLFFAAMLASSPSLAVVQTPTAIVPGMQVVDPSGAPVGTVSSVKGQELIVKTDKHEVLLPATSFTPNQGKLLFALTQAQLNAQTEQAIAEANAKLVAGSSVYGQAGALAGTIEAIDDATVTIKLTSGSLIRIPRNGIAPGPKGAILGISAAELQSLSTQAQK